MAKGERKNLERLLRSAWERQTALRANLQDAGDGEVMDKNRSNPLNIGDSIGLLGLLAGIFLVIFAPPLLFKAILLTAVLIGFVIFIHRSHWTHKWSKSLKATVSSIIVLSLGGLTVPQLLNDWNVEQTPVPVFNYIITWGPGQIASYPGPPVTATFEHIAGHLLFRYRSRYKLVGVCFHANTIASDVRDRVLQKSVAYDIVDEPEALRIDLDEGFQKEELSVRGTSYALLLVPKNVSPSQFSTIRQAEAMGAVMVQGTTGPLP
jgi:hypothetical protein